MQNPIDQISNVTPEMAALLAQLLASNNQQLSQQVTSLSVEKATQNIINLQDIVQQNKQTEPSSPQVPSTSTATAVDHTQISALPNTVPTAENAGCTIAAQQAQSEFSMETVQSTTSTLIRPVFDKDKILPIFRKDLGEIYIDGVNLKNEENKYTGKVQLKAIDGLAKILGVRQKYFDGITPEANRVLFDELYQTCRTNGIKGKTIRTTEFHLLSRLLRQSDRKQASADAKILIRAHNEKQTEKTFAAWVKGKGTLSEILKEIVEYERKEQKKTRNSDPSKYANRVVQAVAAAQTAGSWSTAAILSVQDLPKAIKALIPPQDQWHPIVIKQHGDELHFYRLSAVDKDNADEEDSESLDQENAATEK